MQIVSILSVDNNKARVQLDDNSIIDGVVIVYPAGFFANLAIDDNSLGLFFQDGSKDYAYVMPINIAKQPLLLPNQIAIGDNILIESNKMQIDIDLDINAKLDVSGDTTIQTKPFLTHSHSGVQSGGSNTGGVS